MSQFNQQLLEAKKKHRLKTIRTLILLILAVLIVLTAVLASRGTRIKIMPDEAAELATIHRQSGLAVVLGETLYSLSTQPAIAVTADGFKPLVQALDKKHFGQLMTLTMTPLPAQLELSTTAGNKVNWLINDELVAIAETLNHSLPAGDYTLTVNHPYYQDESLSLSLARNESVSRVISLTAINGSLSVKSRPAGAHILVDETEQGVSPLKLALQGGRHVVNVIHDNFEPIQDTIEISRQQIDVVREYNLEIKKAALNLSLTPEGGRLVLDDAPLNVSHQLRVATGVRHRLTYQKPGYFSQTKSFSLTPDQSLDLAFSLKKETGRVVITSSPVAEVFLNGQATGSTPLQLSLDAIQQTISLRKPGYRSITRQIIPSAKAAVSINVNLLDEKTARFKEAQPLYTHKAGGALKLFTPNQTFTMGAERSERGQRANEFVRQVTLSKAFYAGVDEVSIAEYRQFDNNITGQPQLPVTAISWINAARFCNWLSQMEGLQAVYRINNGQLIAVNANTDGYRLLTEVEWEWLARQSARTRRTRFVWGNDYVIPAKAVNIADESAVGTLKRYVSKYNDGYPGVAPVKHFSREISGLYDQGGNVSEWTHDSYSLVRHGDGKLSNPFDRTVSQVHVVKGANWRSGTVTELRAAFREGVATSRDDLGFRIGRYVFGGKYQ